MNPALDKMLREFASTHFYGTVEIQYVNGIPTIVNVKKTYKLTSTAQHSISINRETRGDSHGQPATENR